MRVSFAELPSAEGHEIVKPAAEYVQSSVCRVVDSIDDSRNVTASVTDVSKTSSTCARINIYPNPVSWLMNVSVPPGRYDLASISVNDMNGKAIFGTELNAALFDQSYEGVFDVSELANGAYLVVVRFDDGSTCATKVVVQ